MLDTSVDNLLLSLLQLYFNAILDGGLNLRYRLRYLAPCESLLYLWIAHASLRTVFIEKDIDISL